MPDDRRREHAHSRPRDPAPAARSWSGATSLFPGGRCETPILRRESLGPGRALEGPAIIEQLDATTVLPPGFRATADDAGNLVIDVPAP